MKSFMEKLEGLLERGGIKKDIALVDDEVRELHTLWRCPDA